MVWDVSGLVSQSVVRPLRPDDLAQCWASLAQPDAGRAYKSIWSLIDGGDEATSFLRGQLKPSNSADRKQISKWIEQLDHSQFAVRERATAALVKVADQAEEDLRQALTRSTPEVRDRIRRILDSLNESAQTPERLRMIRTLEVLEGQGTAAARTVLDELSRGAPQAFLTKEAADSLRRLDRRDKR